MSDKLVVEKLVTKEGASDGRPWKRTAVKDAISGEWLSTFDEGLAGLLQEGKTYMVDYESKPVNGRVVRDLKAVKPVDAGAELPDGYTATKPDGTADWDLKGLHMSRAAFWKHYLGSQLAASIYVKAFSDEGRNPIDAIIQGGVRLVVAAERDTFERPPGDDGVPF